MQSGRSIIEMICVLAISSVVGLAGVSGIKGALFATKQNQMEKFASSVFAECDMKAQALKIRHGLRAQFDNAYFMAIANHLNTANYQVSAINFSKNNKSLTIANQSKELCQKLKENALSYRWNVICDGNNITFQA